RVRKEVLDSDRLGGRPQPIGAGRGVKGFEDRELGEFRQIFFDGVFDRETALLHELHSSGRGDGFRHRRDPEQCVDPERTPLGDIGNAEGALIDDTIAVGRHHDDTGDLLAGNGIAHRLVDSGWLELLCTGSERQSCNAATESYELAPLHWIVLPLAPRGQPRGSKAKISRRGAALYDADASRVKKAGPHCLSARSAAIQWDDAHVGSSWLPRKRAEVKALQIAIALPASEEGLRRRLRLVEFPAQWDGTKSWHCMSCCRSTAIAFPEDAKVPRRMPA